jgi:hypothetical protein
MRPVRDHGVGVAVEPAQRGSARKVRKGPGVGPERRPEDEGHARPARPAPRGRKGDAARGPADDRAVFARRRERRHVALAHAPVRHLEDAGFDAAVRQPSPEERHRQPLARMQGGERARAVRRGVAGDEEHGPVIACGSCGHSDSSAARYASSVAAPQRSHVNRAATVSRARAPRA